jgi:hypothetical protein
MTSKQRVHAALKREPDDRVPIFMWFHHDTAVRLADLLEIPPNNIYLVIEFLLMLFFFLTFSKN